MLDAGSGLTCPALVSLTGYLPAAWLNSVASQNQIGGLMKPALTLVEKLKPEGRVRSAVILRGEGDEW